MKGSCLCGAIEVVAPEHSEVSLCHCNMCRKWSSGAFHALHGGQGIQFIGAEPKRYRSSEWAERGFCDECGTHLFYHLLVNDDYVLSAGLFALPNAKLTLEIFTDEKPEYYALHQDSHKMTGREVFEQFAPKE